MLVTRARGLLRALSLVAATAAAHTTPVHAASSRGHSPETPPVVGVVRDTTGAPLANVQVIVAELDRVSSTNAEG